jgi:hypothetical protein
MTMPWKGIEETFIMEHNPVVLLGYYLDVV